MEERPIYAFDVCAVHLECSCGQSWEGVCAEYAFERMLAGEPVEVAAAEATPLQQWVLGQWISALREERPYVCEDCQC